MKITLELGPDAQVEIKKDERGSPVSIVFTPLFTSPHGQAVLAYGDCKTESGAKVDQFSLLVSGKSGRVAKRSRTGVKAAIDAPAIAPASAIARGKP